MNETHVTVVGNVVADPVRRVTKSGDPYVTFRVASTVRRYDAPTNGYVDVDTSFVDVRAFRRLARNVADSIGRGHPVVVSGRLRVREWTTGERSGTAVEIDARAVGHDLTWGTAAFTRERRLDISRSTVAVSDDDSSAGAPDADGATEWGALSGEAAAQPASTGEDSQPATGTATGLGDPAVDAYEIAS